ncbi:hypothetical protein I317_02726 [Kwoniella heveanensis CBS 569]|nr:hypothetical protein I317_02726 [Kwoniella heveanensis CBS 569]
MSLPVETPQTPPGPSAPDYLLTPPPTDAKKPKTRQACLLPASSPTAQSLCIDGHKEEDADHGRTSDFGPMVLFDTSRQQQLVREFERSASPAEMIKEKNKPQKEPLFLPADEDGGDDDTPMDDDADDVVFTHEIVHHRPEPRTAESRVVGRSPDQSTAVPSQMQALEPSPSFRPVTSARNLNRSLVRSHDHMRVYQPTQEEEDDDDEIEFTGRLTKKPRNEITNGSNASTPSSGPLRAISPGDDGPCRSCGCSCDGRSQPPASSGRSKGSGSQTLSNYIRGNIVGKFWAITYCFFHKVSADQ